MIRKTFKHFTIIFLVSLFVTVGRSEANAFENYRPGLVKSALSKGQTVLLDFYAPWCPVCRAQEKVLKGLKSSNPEYFKSIRLVRVSWDKYKNSEISKKYRVRRQATLVLVNNKRTLGKVVAKTSKSSIERLIKKGI